MDLSAEARWRGRAGRTSALPLAVRWGAATNKREGEVCQVGVRGQLNCCRYICGDGIMWEVVERGWREGAGSCSWLEPGGGRTDRRAQRGAGRELEW